ncbi:hypothetical protein AB0392_37685 [Nonomuraea angiospora]|uniref:hypothetical protein n=1 Tax=Nonomuraea angiospora TaxID=46172 RepID=UPI0034500A97
MNRLTQISFTAAPAALLAGSLLTRLPGADAVGGPWWAAAHAVLLAGFLMFGVMLLALRRMAGPVTGGWRAAADVATGMALLSTAANVAGLAVDLYNRFESPRVAAWEPFVYGAAFAALVALAFVLAALRRVTPLSAAVTAMGVAVLVAGCFEPALTPVGMALLWLGTLLLSRGPAEPAGQIGYRLH